MQTGSQNSNIFRARHILSELLARFTTPKYSFFLSTCSGSKLVSLLYMGNLISPPQDTLVLVPPRFSTRGLTRPIEIENPMSVYFGNLFRREVLQDLHSFNGRFGLDVLIAPEQPPTAAAHLEMSCSSERRVVEGGALNLHFNKQILRSVHGLGRVALGTGTGVSGYAMLTHELDQGRVSVTGSTDPGEDHKVGLRVSTKRIMAGAELPYSTPADVSAWIIARPLPDITLGLMGAFLRPEAPVEMSVSLDKRIANTDSTYCVCSTLRTPSNELIVGFSQHLVTHRKVYNPFEDKQVKFIANYIDIAVEAKTKVGKSTTAETDVSAGVSWQPNKNILSKIHVSTIQGVAATLAVRNWWSPSVLASASVGLDTSGNPFVGGRLQVSNWLTAVEYERGQRVSELPTTRWLSVEDVCRFDNRYRI